MFRIVAKVAFVGRVLRTELNLVEKLFGSLTARGCCLAQTKYSSETPRPVWLTIWLWSGWKLQVFTQ